MLRNFLVLIRRRWKLDKVQILCYRDAQAKRHEARSIVFNLELDVKEAITNGNARGSLEVKDLPKVTGWERSAGKVASRVANLGEYMDPQR